uniref:Dolichol kinase n=1 Tax=Globisporangium ultimum (strain ATCC 200006 / CBS 805.95 / DAOM BR144) TaxID=431595 RepID=K3X455_GLOUD
MELLAFGAWIAGIVIFQFVASRGVRFGSSGSGGARSHSSAHLRPHDLQSFPLRTELHLQRKVQHTLTGLLFYAVSWVMPLDIAVIILLIAVGVLYGVHQLRKSSPRVDALYVASFHGILRRDEASKTVLPGAFYFVLGTAIAAAVYPLPVARLAILCLGVGDPAASLMGTLYNQHDKKNVIKSTKKKKQKSQSTKSWAGFVGALVASFAATFLAMSWSDTQKTPIEDKQVVVRTAKALFAGTAAAVAEAIDVAGWDDNLSLPLIVGLFLQLGSYAFGFQY